MKKFMTFVLTLMIAVGCSVTSYAETFYGKDDWGVRFTADKEMKSTFTKDELDDVIKEMQPGDTVIMHLTLTNEYSEKTNWYMSNKVLYSLEDRSKNDAVGGGAYTYDLRYTDPSGAEKILFTSGTVGGDTIDAAGEGLHEATDSLDEFFHLDSLTQGQKGTVVLTIVLDGETQGNDYQNTLADLMMNFAVELEGKTVIHNPKTGDTTDIMPYVIAAGVSGVVLLGLAICSLNRQKKRSAA